MSTYDLIDDFYRHMEWADAEVWRTTLAAETTVADSMLRELLQHIHLVQNAFLDMWSGREIDVEAVSNLQGAELATWARQLHRQIRDHLQSLNEDRFSETIEMPWAAQVAERLGFAPKATTVRDTLVQVWAHSQHHRGQVSTRLRELGETPPTVDYIAWIWRGRPAAEWP